MGLRAMDMTLQNCGTGVYRVEGYPGLDLLDEDQRSVTGISVVHDSGDRAPGQASASAAPPRPVTLQPGETATADLQWRNTVTEAGGPMNLPYMTVEAKPGALPVLVAPDGGLDLGTTGKLRVGPWRATRADGVPASGGGSS
jgi:hypothetical protein